MGGVLRQCWLTHYCHVAILNEISLILKWILKVLLTSSPLSDKIEMLIGCAEDVSGSMLQTSSEEQSATEAAKMQLLVTRAREVQYN